MKNKFSKNILEEIIKEFPDWEQLSNTESKYLEIDIPADSKSKLGGLVIQTTKDKSIWIRNYHPCSAYIVNNVSELIKIIKDNLLDKVLWVIESKDDQWTGTTFITQISDMETEIGTTYKILSWSGALDKEFTAA